MLYLAHSRVGNLVTLVLRHSGPHFPPNSRGIDICVLNGETQRRALPCYQSEEIEIFYYLISPGGIDAIT